jgi:hypothetical protein
MDDMDRKALGDLILVIFGVLIVLVVAAILWRGFHSFRLPLTSRLPQQLRQLGDVGGDARDEARRIAVNIAKLLEAGGAVALGQSAFATVSG